MTTIPHDSNECNENADGQDDVPIALSSIYRNRTIGTILGELQQHRSALSTTNGEDKCSRGVGALLRSRSDERDGRDVQLPCKRNSCEVCGPENRVLKQRRILSDFGTKGMHAVEVADGGKEWEALSKSLERSGADYHRIPTSEGKAIVVTTADIGGVVKDPRTFVKEILEAQPCDPGEKRRASSSRNWKGAGDRFHGSWRREGISPLRQEERVQVYDEEGCNPVEVPEEERPPSVVPGADRPCTPMDLAAPSLFLRKATVP